MIILFDIKHVAHVNFFKPLINSLVDEGEQVLISYIQRGRLEKIIKSEFSNVESYYIGRHRGTKWSIIYEANILKFFSALRLLRKKNVSLMLGVDAFVTGFACKLLGIPNLQFYDDPERKVNLWLEQKTSSELYYPAIKDFSGSKVQTYEALKEWAYLSPTFFEPDLSSIDEYNLKPNEYYFVREVDNGSLNYQGQESGLIAQVSKNFPEGVPVLLSLENKSQKHLYPENWILLQEPIPLIHSLMYYSKSVISSGDSMAREGAMLGVPSFYVGFREMSANNFIEKEGRFFVASPEELISQLCDLSNDYSSSKKEYRESLEEKWINVTEMMKSLINKYSSN